MGGIVQHHNGKIWAIPKKYNDYYTTILYNYYKDLTMVWIYLIKLYNTVNPGVLQQVTAELYLELLIN